MQVTRLRAVLVLIAPGAVFPSESAYAQSSCSPAEEQSQRELYSPTAPTEVTAIQEAICVAAKSGTEDVALAIARLEALPSGKALCLRAHLLSLALRYSEIQTNPCGKCGVAFEACQGSAPFALENENFLELGQQQRTRVTFTFGSDVTRVAFQTRSVLSDPDVSVNPGQPYYVYARDAASPARSSVTAFLRRGTHQVLVSRAAGLEDAGEIEVGLDPQSFHVPSPEAPGDERTFGLLFRADGALAPDGGALGIAALAGGTAAFSDRIDADLAVVLAPNNVGAWLGGAWLPWGRRWVSAGVQLGVVVLGAHSEEGTDWADDSALLVGGHLGVRIVPAQPFTVGLGAQLYPVRSSTYAAAIGVLSLGVRL